MPLLRTPFFIAKRYFLSQRKNKDNGLFVLVFKLLYSLFSFSQAKIIKSYKHLINLFIGRNFISILSNISIFGVGIGTAALIIVLSVFNGLEELTRGMFRAYNAELKVSPKRGKSFTYTKDMRQKLINVDGIDAITEVIEDNALLKYGDAQIVANVKGVSENFIEQYDLEKQLVSGEIKLKENGVNLALLGIGIKYQLSIQLNNDLLALQIWYPKRDKKISLNPNNAFYRQSIFPGGVLSIDQQFDYNQVIVPLTFMEKLLKYEKRRTSLEIKANNRDNLSQIQKEIQNILGDEFQVHNEEEQQASILRAVKIERFFGYITFAFILGLASFNVFFSLAMLTIEKKKDISILLSMGASQSMIRSIFLMEGAIIGFIGGASGLLLGFIICFIQQEFGIISLGVNNPLVESYPVKMKFYDFFYTGFTVFFITIIASLIPARNSARTKINDYL